GVPEAGGCRRFGQGDPGGQRVISVDAGGVAPPAGNIRRSRAEQDRPARSRTWRTPIPLGSFAFPARGSGMAEAARRRRVRVGVRAWAVAFAAPMGTARAPLPIVILAAALPVAPVRAELRILETAHLRLIYQSPSQRFIASYAAQCFENAFRFHARTFAW